MSRLTSLNELKDMLRVPQAETGLDTLLATLIEETSADCEQFCARTFTKQAYSNEPHKGGGTKIVLLNYPVDLTQTFQLKDFDGQTTTVLDESGYVVDEESGVVTLFGGWTFSEGPSGAQASYSGGYDASNVGTADEKVNVPAGLSRSVRRVCAARYKADQGALTQAELDAIEQAEQVRWARYRGVA